LGANSSRFFACAAKLAICESRKVASCENLRYLPRSPTLNKLDRLFFFLNLSHGAQ